MSAAYVEEEIARGGHLIPSHMIAGVKRYVLHGIPMGSFGTALFGNDFLGAAGRADEENLACLAGWANFLYNYVPSGCKGSPDSVSEWIASGGVVGHHAEQVAS